MRNLLKQFKKGSRGVRLTSEEKSVMRQTLVHFARVNPIVHTAEAKHSRAVVSLYSFMRKARGFKIVSATVIGGILIGGTVSFAAEGALPGNVLYPVKTEVNERVRGVMAVTPHAKAGWDIRLVERRLSEVKEVGLIESVPLETKEVARANVKKYIERAQKRIVELDDSDDNEGALLVAENLARVLQTHETILLDDIHKKTSEQDDDEDKQANVEIKKSSRFKKETERVRTTVSTSTPSVKIENSINNTERGKRPSEDTNSTRIKKSDTESLEKTIDDIREVRENLEKRNKEKKAEYERRKETRKEEGQKEEKDEERKTYISAPSSESER